MKNIKNYKAEKYYGKGSSQESDYNEIEKEIYELKKRGKKLYLTSLSFEQEPKYGEGSSAGNISQYPLEDLLDRFYCHVSDFYEELNNEESKICYLEFASNEIKDIRNLRGIIGKHVYNKTVKEDDREVVRQIIE